VTQKLDGMFHCSEFGDYIVVFTGIFMTFHHQRFHISVSLTSHVVVYMFAAYIAILTKSISYLILVYKAQHNVFFIILKFLQAYISEYTTFSATITEFLDFVHRPEF
jgi:penicillin-binding protein-related factor A (putative recombinase)